MNYEKKHYEIRLLRHIKIFYSDNFETLFINFANLQLKYNGCKCYNMPVKFYCVANTALYFIPSKNMVISNFKFKKEGKSR